MKTWSIALISGLGLAAMNTTLAQAAPCMTVTITGSVGGPQAYQGNANAGTLVGYGDDANNCSAVRLQYDAGRGTLQATITNPRHFCAAQRDFLHSHAQRPQRRLH